MAGTWGILVRRIFRPIRIFSLESQSLRLLSDEYCRCGFAPVAESHALNRPVVRNVGLGVIVKTSPTGRFHVLSLFAHVPVPNEGTRMKEQWPPIFANGELIPLTCDQRIPLMGGRRFLRHRLTEDSLAWDAWWSLSPRYVWKCLISGALTHGGAVNGGLIP